MNITFITGNQHKFQELSAIIPNLDQKNVNLPEIQSIDPHHIIAAKLAAAQQLNIDNCIVEDTSFYLRCMNGLPGPYIKWFLETVGPQGLYTIAKGFGDFHATATVTIGLSDQNQQIHYFEGSIEGTVVPPVGSNGFGFDVVFVPEGYDQTFGQLSTETKNTISHRGLAGKKLLDHLQQQN